MSTKDLFKKGNKVLTKSQEEKIKKDLESPELAKDVVRANNKFHSHIDFSKPENFSFYGSAQKYYEDSFNRVYQTYPYDGSLSEKEKWFYDSSELDLWILDNVYPKSTGYVRLGTNQSIFVKGGPNKEPSVIEGEKEELSKQFPVKQGNSNIWDPSIQRTSNLHMDLSLGFTVELWMKFDNPEEPSFTPFVIGNSGTTGRDGDGSTGAERLSIQSLGSGSGILTISLYDDDFSGGTDFNATGLNNFFESTWNHYSFSFINSGDKVKTEIYKNGILVADYLNGTSLGEISQEELYLNINGAMSNIAATRSKTTDGMYVDEFRFWKRRRTAEEIGRYWHTHIDGGTNTDDNKYSLENRKVDIGVYYKFNEGITGYDDIDSTVLDYSGRISNGEIINYNSLVRSTGSAFNESEFFEVSEERDPIIYSSHPAFISTKEAYMQEGLTYDYTNNSSIYHTMPAWIIEEDEQRGDNAKELSQVISSYFDSAQIKIKELVSLKDVEYHTLEERANKPYTLIRRTLESAGMIVPDLFVEASAFEEILSRNEKEKFEEKMQDVKNTVYQNIYNNLSYIYKSKGTEKAFRNLIRCFGVDDELIKINLYSDGADYTLEDSRRTTSIKKKFIDFNNGQRDQGIVYTKEDSNNSDSTSYIRGVPSDKDANISFTFQTEIIFPKRVPVDHVSYQPPTNSEEHIAYLGVYSGGYTTTSNENDVNGNGIFELKAVKEGDNSQSENVKFVLNLEGQSFIETDFVSSVYENSKWNLAVRLVPKKDLSSRVFGGSTTDYRVELYCVRMLADLIEEEILETKDLSETEARSLLQKDKFVSVGAKSTTGNPENAPVNNSTRLKISSVLFWYDYLTNEEIRAHGSDASNFGRLYPSEEAYLLDDDFNTVYPPTGQPGIQVPRRDTLAMHWDFSEVTTTDANGEFIVDDISGGVESGRYGWFTELVGHQVTGRGVHFDANDDQVVNREFIYSAKHRTPEVINSEDLVEIRNQDDLTFTKQAQVVTHFFAAEKSMYQVISDDMINLFATLVEFNNLIGQPVNRYRMQYKALEKFRARYFEKVKNVPSLEKYIELYKWIDSSIGLMIQDLIPVSSNFSADLRNMVESHVLERNKYWTKFPTMEMAGEPPLGIIKSINELTYNWKDGHYRGLGTKNIYYGAEFAGNNNSYIEFPDTDELSFTNGAGSDDSFSVSLWVKPASYNTGILFRKGEPLPSSSSEYSVAFSTNTQSGEQELSVLFSNSTNPAQGIMGNIYSPSILPTNKYSHLFITYDGSEFSNGVRVYVDRVLQTPLQTATISYLGMQNSTSDLIVGKGYEGRIRDLIFYNTAILSTDIQNYPFVFTGDDEQIFGPDVLFHWSFDTDANSNTKFTVNDGTSSNVVFPPPLVKALNDPDDSFLWFDKRVQGIDPLVTTGDPNVDANREILRRVSTRVSQGNTVIVDERDGNKDVEEDKPILRQSPPSQGVPGSAYSGQAYVTRALSKPYKLNLDISDTLHGGVNYSPTTKDPNAYVRAMTRIIPGDVTVGIDVDLANNPVTYEQWKELYTVKRSITVTIADTELDLTENYDGDVFYPYYGEDFRDPSAFITGHHNDSYGDDAEIPVQSPFTETWVGGNQHRHVPWLTGYENKGSANFVTNDNKEIVVPADTHNDFSFTSGAGQDYSFAISFWAKPNLSATQYVISKCLTHNKEWHVHLDQDTVRLNLFAMNGNGTNSMKSRTELARIDLDSDEWHHVVVNFQAALKPNYTDSFATFYINNVFAGFENLAGSYNGMGIRSYIPVVIGNIQDTGPGLAAGPNGMNGELRDIVIFNFKNQSTGLSASDVEQLYNDNIANHPRSSKIVGWWKLYQDGSGYLGRDGVVQDGITFNTFPPVANPFARPELYVEQEETLKHPHEANPFRAAARYTRDEVAKRPINIRNIKTGESHLLGNYAKDYEVVQTSSRAKNNRWFVKNEGSITSTYTESPFISGSFEFELPDRGRTEHVIVERFSAPGDPLTLSRGYLDRISEEFSVHNSINYRNFDDRETHKNNLVAHSDLFEGSQGYIDDTNGLANIHKINRNTIHIPTGKNYDNAFVSHQIPRSDFQYNVEMLSETRKFYDFENFSDWNNDFIKSGGSAVFIASAGGQAFRWNSTHSAALVDPPAGSGFTHKYLQYKKPIHSKVTISFTFEDESANVVGENLYLQYSFAPDTSWTTLEVFEQGFGYTHTNGFYQATVDLGQSINNPIYFRWVVRRAAPNGNGLWSVDSITISPTSLMQYPEHADIVKGSNSYADYQGAGFRFIRNADKKAVVEQRKNNIYSQLNRDITIGARDRSVSSFTEPAVSWNKPNTHFVLNERYDELVRSGREAPSDGESNVRLRARRQNIRKNSNPITYSYSNGLEMFSNKALTRAINRRVRSNSQFVDALMALFRRADLLFSKSIAREIIFPKHKNVGLKKSRNRSYFDSYKFFWKDQMLDRISCSGDTKMGYVLKPEFQDIFRQQYSVDVMDNYFLGIAKYTHASFNGSTSVIEVPDAPNLSFTSGGMSISFSVRLPDLTRPIDTLIYKVGEYYININPSHEDGVPLFQFGMYPQANDNTNLVVNFYKDIEQDRWYNVVFTYDGGLNEAAMKCYIDGESITSQTTDSMTNSMDDTTGVLRIGSGVASNAALFMLCDLKDLSIYSKALTQLEAAGLNNNILFPSDIIGIISNWKLNGNANDSVGNNHGTSTNVTFSFNQDFYQVLGDLTYLGEDRMRAMITRNDTDTIHTSTPTKFDALGGICGEQRESTDIVPVYSSDKLVRQKSAPIPSPQLYHNPYNEEYKESQGWINRKSIVSEQKANYDNYGAYSEEIRAAAQNYGLVSEFRISEHMDKYILENGGNFRTKNYDFLTLDGASYDGEFHTLSSGTSLRETSSFYSIKKEDNSLALTDYPDSLEEALTKLIKNNAEGYFNFNPIYSPSESDFGVSNSVNSEIEINETVITNYTSISPYQNGINAAGKFNLYSSDDDYLEITIDNFTKQQEVDPGQTPQEVNSLTFTMSNNQIPDPVSISVWAQPENLQDGTDVDYSNGMWTLLDNTNSNNRVCLFSSYHYAEGGAGYQNLGLTFVATDLSNSGLPGATVADNDTVYTFFKSDKSVANLEQGKMNNVVLQIIPPEADGSNPTGINYLIKAWLNGEELYGVHIRELDGTIYSDRKESSESINGYSPCPIGAWLGSGGNPWFTDYDNGNFSNANALKDLSFVQKATLGMVTTSHKFRGLLDEFSIFRGILPKSSIEAIYGNGQPNNINELVANGQIVGNCTYSTSFILFPLLINGVLSGQRMPMTVDSGEFDFAIDASEGKSIEILTGTTDPTPATVNFDDNYSVEEQKTIEATLPVWHRIGVPSYNIISRQGTWDEDFFDTYVHTDNIDFIERADKKHDRLGVETTERVRLKVNVVKKLLPYEGFYPQDRTVQLANLFVEKISPDIIYNEKVHKEQAVQAALQHFFAPGILYNSIKAGMACDWASHTNRLGIQPSYRESPVVVYPDGDISQAEVRNVSIPAPTWYLLGNIQGAPINLYDTTDAEFDSTDYSTLNSFMGYFQLNFYTPDNDRIPSFFINGVPDKRLPFESILDPYAYLRDGDDSQLIRNPVDSNSNLYLYSKPNQYYLMKPTYYKDAFDFTNGTASLDSQIDSYCYPSFELKADAKNSDFRYELAANNFIAESTKFFIKDEELSSFAATRPQGSGYMLKQGVTYYMDVVLSKSEEFKPVNSPGSLGGRYFGPPVSTTNAPRFDGTGSLFTSYQNIKSIVTDPSYAPYTPPYFYGETTARISFECSSSRTYSLDEIFQDAEVEQISEDMKGVFAQNALSNAASIDDGTDVNLNWSEYTSSPAYLSRMPISASIELFGKTKLSRQEYDALGMPTSISTPNADELDTWVIYTKFECPLFDFSDNANSSNEGTLTSLGITKESKEEIISKDYQYVSYPLERSNQERFTTDARTGSGIWAGYGRQVDGNGVTISIQESFPKNRDPSIDSLLKVCGFTPSTKQVGRVADSKEISEAIVMIPFVDSPIKRQSRNFNSDEAFDTVRIDDRNFIRVSPAVHAEQRRRIDANEPIYLRDNEFEVRETSITKMVKGMRKYNIPPLYDFETFGDIEPFAMYFFEFNHTLDREDLSNIWQGLQPKLSKQAVLDSIEISHEINSFELFGDLQEIPKGIRWMVFKVKKKAEKSYYRLTEDSRDDRRFKFNFDVGIKEPEYGYNYPYDYFTMLEMVQVEVNSEKDIDPLEQYRKIAGEEE